MKYDPFIYGKDQTSGVTSIEIDNAVANLYLSDGTKFTVPNTFYILYASNYTGDFIRLDGDLYYKYAEKFDSKSDYDKSLAIAKARNWDHYTIYNPKEAFMIKSGVTYYKGMNPSDLKVLSFDIETTGLNKYTDKLLMISNTYRDKEKTIRKLFSIDEYNSEKEMIYAWSNFINDLDPDVLVGHNIFGFDLPFLQHRGEKLPIGKMHEEATFASRTSQFRKDGSQSYEYTNVLVPGREIVDTFHLAIKYDIGRNYPSYGLKQIIAHEKLEVKDRQHWDFKNGIPTPDHPEWETFKKYAEHDADDALALFDLMIPAFFYYTQHIPKTLQQIINSATGSQINSFLVRSYLSEGHSLPLPTEIKEYSGGISFGNPGIYKYVAKVDVASLYPSIIRQYDVYDKDKDPKKYFLRMVDYFTKERLQNKAKAKETGDRYYKDVEQAQKIVINSAYGFMGAPGLLFNSPESAAFVTSKGREILETGLAWAKKNNLTIVNADTDSFSFTNGTKFPIAIYKNWIKDLNSLFPEMIRWEDDGLYSKVIVVKAKNYVLQSATDGQIILKGSALKATMKEPALKGFIKDIINALMEDENGNLSTIYNSYVRDIHNINESNIHLWCSKKTITEAVLNPQRTNEARIKEAIQAAQKTVSEGDRIFVFFKEEDQLALLESFDGTYSKKKLLGKLYKTIEIFKPILDMSNFPNYTLKKNAKQLEEITK